jgi:hypothetical protein
MMNLVWMFCGMSQIAKLPAVIAASTIPVMIKPFLDCNPLATKIAVYNIIENRMFCDHFLLKFSILQLQPS